MDAASPAIQHAPLGYRHLKNFKDTMLNKDNLIKKKVLLTSGSIQDSFWWFGNICTSSKNVWILTLDIVLETDNSKKRLDVLKLIPVKRQVEIGYACEEKLLIITLTIWNCNCACDAAHMSLVLNIVENDLSKALPSEQ